MHDCNTDTLVVDRPSGEDVISPLDALNDDVRDLINRSLELLIPVEPQPLSSCSSSLSGYDSFVHSKLCRMRLLGLSHAAAARACGISQGTLTNWLRSRPKLSTDMDSAGELANAHAAVLLRKMMDGGGPTAFNAVRFFLSTHSPDFKERSVIEVAPGDPADVVSQIRHGMYGLDGDDAPVLDAPLPAASAAGDVDPDPLGFDL